MIKPGDTVKFKDQLQLMAAGTTNSAGHTKCYWFVNGELRDALIEAETLVVWNKPD